jgi:predicted Zn-dependent peptidase
MEKNVIIEDIGMYDDQPMMSAFDRAKRVYFADHPLGNTILGTKESVAALTREQMHAYFERRYVAPNITVVATGNFEWKNLTKLVAQRSGKWSSGPIGRKGVQASQGSGVFELVTREAVAQEHVILMSPGPAAHSPLRYAAGTLGMIVGDDAGSRLYWALVDPGLAESADMSFHDYEGTGSFYTSFSCEPENTAKNLGITHHVLRDVQKSGVSEEELQQARSKIMSRIVRASERPLGRMQAIGMDWIYLGKYRTADEELKAYEAVSVKTIGRLIEKYPLDQITTLALGPLKKLRPIGRNGRG